MNMINKVAQDSHSC